MLTKMTSRAKTATWQDTCLGVTINFDSIYMISATGYGDGIHSNGDANDLSPILCDINTRVMAK